MYSNYRWTNYFYISPWTQISTVGKLFWTFSHHPVIPTVTAFLQVSNNTVHKNQEPSLTRDITLISKLIYLTPTTTVRDWFGDMSDLILSYFPVPSVNLFMNYVIYFWSILEILQIRDTCTCRNPSGAALHVCDPWICYTTTAQIWTLQLFNTCVCQCECVSSVCCIMSLHQWAPVVRERLIAEFHQSWLCI